MVAQVVWLASFGDGKRDVSGHRVQHKWINEEAAGDLYVKSSLGTYERQNDLEEGAVLSRFVSGNEVVGLVWLEPLAEHHSLLPLSLEMQAQFNMWNNLGDGSPLREDFFYFRVLKAQPLLHRLSLKDAETKSGRSTCFFHMNDVWAQRFFATNVLGVDETALRVWHDLSGKKIPTLGLKVPKPIAFLVANACWTNLAVPGQLNNMDLKAGWHVKHILKADSSKELQNMRDSFLFLPSHELAAASKHVQHDFFNVASVQGKERMLEFLQSVDTLLFQDARPPTAEAKTALRVQLMAAAKALQVDQFQVSDFRRQHDVFLMKRRKYPAIRLLHFFWVAGSLHHDQELRDMLRHVCLVALPPDMAEEAVSFIDGNTHEGKLRLPSAATVSRVRARLDVAWTLLMRSWVMERLRQGGGRGLRVYAQTDATWQAKQEYQVTVLNFVESASLKLLHQDYDESYYSTYESTPEPEKKDRGNQKKKDEHRESKDVRNRDPPRDSKRPRSNEPVSRDKERKISEKPMKKQDAADDQEGMNCPICHKWLKNRHEAWKSHQKASVRCAYRRGEADTRKQCRNCSKWVANNRFSWEQHNITCTGTTSRLVLRDNRDKRDRHDDRDSGTRREDHDRHDRQGHSQMSNQWNEAEGHRGHGAQPQPEDHWEEPAPNRYGHLRPPEPDHPPPSHAMVPLRQRPLRMIEGRTSWQEQEGHWPLPHPSASSSNSNVVQPLTAFLMEEVQRRLQSSLLLLLLQDILELDNYMSRDWEERLQTECFEADQACMKRIADRIVWHVTPIIMLAHSRTNLPAKTRVFLHSLALLCPSRRALCELCDSVVSLRTDYGTEKGISRISNCPLDLFLPYMHAEDRETGAGDGEMFAEEFNAHDVDHFFVDDELCQDVDDSVVSFDPCFEGPDMMHIIHNATNYLEDVVDCYAPTIAALKSICSLLAGRESKQQLIETCFQSGPSIAFAEEIKSFNITVHDKRWNTIASGIEEVNNLEPALRSHWNLLRFLGKTEDGRAGCEDEAPTHRPGGDSDEFGVNLKAVDDALCSDFFWGSIKVLLQVAVVQRQAVRFVNGCPCHDGLLQATDNPIVKEMCESCPLRGRRCAELAAGNFFELLESLFQSSGTALELKLPRGLEKDQVLQLMKDFEMCRRHLISTYVLKLSFWTQAPHVLAGLAHWDPRVRSECLRKCVESDSDHPKIQIVQQHMDAVHTFLEAGGVWLDDWVVEPLKMLASEMRLMFTSAWRVEGQHARTKRAAQRAPHHSAAYTSLSHRLPEIRAHLRAHPESATQIADLMDGVPNGRAAAQKLGFSRDLLGKCGWISSKTFQKKAVGFGVIYHDDPFCKYSLEVPARVQQKLVQAREIAVEPLGLEDDLQQGSVDLRRSLALQDIRKAASAKMFFSMKFNKAMIRSLQSLLAPLPSPVPRGGSLEWEPAFGSSDLVALDRVEGLGLLASLADLLEGAGDALAHEFVMASALHLHPSRFRRTHVEGEASMAGMWLVQLHSILGVCPAKKEITVSIAAANLGDDGCASSPLALHVNQLSLPELLKIHEWEARDDAIHHRFDNQFMSTVPQNKRGAVLEAVGFLMKYPAGLAVTRDMKTEVVDALDELSDAGFVVGPPWQLTDLAHQRLKQCVVLHSGKPLLRRHRGPMHEASTFQLVLELDSHGMSHEVVTGKKHKQLKKDKLKHVAEDIRSGREDGKIWFTHEGRCGVSHFYLLCLVEMCFEHGSDGSSGHIKEIVYGESDDYYKKVLGLEAGELQMKQPRQKRLKFGHLSDEAWPDEKQDKPKRKRTGRKPTAAKKANSDAASGLQEGDSAKSLAAPPAAMPGPPSSSSSSSSSKSGDEGGSDSDSSSSSSSNTSSSQPKPAGSAAPKAAGKAKAKPSPKVKVKITDRSFYWGDHLITPVGPPGEAPKNYQIRCTKPSHNVERACTKKRSVTFGGADTVLLCLKYWASLGCQCETAQEHWALWDSDVMPAWSADPPRSQPEGPSVKENKKKDPSDDRFVPRYGNLLREYYPLLDMLVKAALPDHPPTGKHSYRLVVPKTEGKVWVRVDLRGWMRTEHPNRQRTFRFEGKEDICRCWHDASEEGVDLYWLAPPPRVRPVRAVNASPADGDGGSNQAAVVPPSQAAGARVGFVPPPDGLPPPPGYYRMGPEDSSSSSSEAGSDGEDSSSSGYHFPPGFFEADEADDEEEEIEEEPEGAEGAMDAEEETNGADAEDWCADEAALMAPKAKAKALSTRGRGRGMGKAKAKPKAGAGKRREPVTTCICPGCPFPKYPGSRFCSTGNHKKAWDNMVYQRRSRKTLSEDEKASFDEAMKDDGHAGRAVLAFARDNPPEMRKKGLVDFTQFMRIVGQKVGKRDATGDVPMTERAFHKHCEHVWGLTEDEAAELWREYDDDAQVERDFKGFRGALRLWIPAHEMKSKEREHYVDNRIAEGSDDHLARQDLSFRDEHFQISADQQADLAMRTPLKSPVSSPADTGNQKPEGEELETPEKSVNLTRERPIFHRTADAGLRKMKAELGKSLQTAEAAIVAWRAHPNDLKTSDRALLAFCRVFQFRLEAGQRCNGSPEDIKQLVPDNSLCSGGSTAGSEGAKDESVNGSSCPWTDGMTDAEKTKIQESVDARKKLSFEDFLKESRTTQQKFWDGDLAALVPFAQLDALVDKILETSDVAVFLDLKKQWTSAQACMQTFAKGIKQAADDLVKHMKVKVAEAAREKKRKADAEAKNQLQKIKEEAKSAADAIKRRKTQSEKICPALFTATWDENAAQGVKSTTDPETLQDKDWLSPWIVVNTETSEAVKECVGGSALSRSLTSWGGQYKRSMAQAKLQQVTYPLDAKTGLNEVNALFSSLVPDDRRVDITEVKGGSGFMEAAWLFGCGAEMKHVGFNSNHAGLIKVLAVGEVRHLLLEWKTFKDIFVQVLGDGADSLGPDDLFEKFREADENKIIELAKRGVNMRQCILKKHDILFVPTGWVSVEVSAECSLIYGFRKSLFLKGSAAQYGEAVEIVKAAGGKSVARMEQILEKLKA
eukprot:Skav210160  [mRNA]  locus=scaffold1811:103411:117781:+ [translate_table: standard]